MPIYAYKCESCDHAKDVLQKISDPLLTVCPTCGAATFKKQLTAAGFQLKGSGWYVTDFKGGAAGAADKGAKEGAKEGESAKSEGKSENAADNKPDNKSEPATATQPAQNGSSSASQETKTGSAKPAVTSAPAVAKPSAPQATGA